jgi:Leucine-rich repeat (LRR) protein
LDCSQFSNDYDVLRQLPFPIVINPITEEDWAKSTAKMDENNIFVTDIRIEYEEFVPPSIFCLLNLETLQVDGTPFENGIVPDSLGNLQKLHELQIVDSPIIKMTEQLGALNNLSMITFVNCSLTYLPDISNLENLQVLQAPHNNLTRLDGIPGVRILSLEINLLDEIPISKKPENLELLDISYNPLKNAVPLLSYNNLEIIFITDTTITSIPSSIDKLQNLTHFDMALNRISHLPTTILNLPHLEHMNISKNLLSPNDIESIRKEFNKSHPQLKLFT